MSTDPTTYVYTDICLQTGVCTVDTAPYTWIFVVATIMMILQAYAVGANDCSNSFAASVGARALTLKQAVFLAFFLEFLGAILAGAATTGTIRKGIADLDPFTMKPELLLFGMAMVQVCNAAWLFIATFWELPVSTTHSVVGSIIGMAIAINGPNSVNWVKTGDLNAFGGSLTGIVISWVLAPVLAGIASGFMFTITRILIMRQPNSYERAAYAFPFYALVAVFIAVFAIVYRGLPAAQKQIDSLPGGLDENKVPLGAVWIAAVIAFGAAVFAGTVGNYFVRRAVDNEMQSEAQKKSEIDNRIPHLSDKASNAIVTKVHLVEVCDFFEDEGTVIKNPDDIEVKYPDKFPAFMGGGRVPILLQSNPVYQFVSYGLNYDIHECIDSDSSVNATHDQCEIFDYRTELYYRFLQVFVSCFNMFAHGSNDVANSIAPFAASYLVWTTGTVAKNSPTPTWILAVGGLSMSCGLMTLGYKVIHKV